MYSLKLVCFGACLALFIFCLENSESKRCNRKTWTCPSTNFSYDNTNAIVVRGVQRKFITDAFSFVLPQLSLKGQRFVNDVMELVNTDSPSILKTLYIFTVWGLCFLSNLNDTPSLCIAARNINASVILEKTQDGNETAAAFRDLGVNYFNLCTMLESATLSNAGCEDLPPVVTLSNRCYKRGTVYQAQEALDLFGKNLPCSLYIGVLELYESSKYADNLLAASFIYALTPEFQCLFNYSEFNLILEVFYMYLNNDVSVCCCNKRKKRYETLCNVLNATTNVKIENLRQIYLVNECASELYNDENKTTDTTLP